MPRSDQVTRQWFLLQKLETARGATLQELAASLPEDLSHHPRTIRRDLDALEAAHIPLMTPLHLTQLAAIVTAGSGLYLILGFVCKVEEV